MASCADDHVPVSGTGCPPQAEVGVESAAHLMAAPWSKCTGTDSFTNNRRVFNLFLAQSVELASGGSEFGEGMNESSILKFSSSGLIYSARFF